MPKSKVRPVFTPNYFSDDAHSDYNNSLQQTLNMELDHGGWSRRRGREFWYARRAFLNSYHLNLERNNGSFKEKLKKSVKEMNEAVVGVVLSICRGVKKRRLGLRAYRVTMSLPSLVLVTMRCFMPWFYKREKM